jgi:hypothetical protein
MCRLVRPSTGAAGMPARFDAIVPGGPGNRIAAAIARAERGRDATSFSRRAGASRRDFALLYPSPDTAHGEAGATARLAKEYGFRSIVLVTTPDQTRCELV